MHIQLYVIEVWLVQYPFQLDEVCLLYNNIRMVRIQTILYGQLSLMEEKRQTSVKEMQ